MRRRVIASLFAAAGLAAIWSLSTGAQIDEPTPCEESCQEQKTECVTACGTHPDPVDCEAECHDQLADCLEECR